MKKLWLTLCLLAALLVLPLTACSGTGSAGSRAPVPSLDPVPSLSPGSTLDEMVKNGRRDLAGQDGVVGGTPLQPVPMDGADGSRDGFPGTGNPSPSAGVAPQLKISDGLTINTFDDYGLKARIAVARANAAARAQGQQTVRTLK